MFRIVLSLIAITLSTAALQGCGSSFAPMKADVSDDVVTGGFAPDGRPYTGLADPAALERIKRMVPPTEANRTLARSVKVPTIRRLGADGKPTTGEPSSFEVKVSGVDGSKTLSFDVPVDGSTSTKEATDGAWTLSVRCSNRDCETAEMKIAKNESASAWVVSSKRVRVEVLGPFNSKPPTAPFTQLLADLQRNDAATLVATEVAWGASVFEVRTKRLCLSGLALATGEGDAPVTLGCESPAGLKASLSGNSTRGDLLIRVDEPSAWAFLRVRGASMHTGPTPTPTPSNGGSSGGSDGGGSTMPKPKEPETGAILPIDFSNKVTEALELDRTNDVIQERIRERWKKSDRLMSFLSKAPAKFPVMVEAMKGLGVPSEIIMITMIESNYFVCPGNPVEVSPVGAVGPWQFMPKTAAWSLIGLTVKPLISTSRQVKDRAGKTKTVTTSKADPADERGDLAKSSRGAAKYWKYLFEKFPSDPKLAIMAYNWGPAGVDRALDCGNDATCLKKKLTAKSLQHRLSAIQAAGFDFWTVRELNMAPTESLEYVVNFVSAQFVGRNPSRYGVEIPSSDYTPASLRCGN